MPKRIRIIFAITLLTVGFAVGTVLLIHRHSSGATQATPIAEAHSQLWHCGMHPQVVQDHPGDCPICHMALTPIHPAGGDQPAGSKPLYWWDPMLGTSSISSHPGQSAMGMEMVPVYADSGGPAVTIDPTVVQNMGVRTAVVVRGPLNQTIRAVGMLNIPEPAMHDVSLKVGGWIDKLNADQDGMHVQKGDVLFELYSPELQVVEQELISSVALEKSLPSDTGPETRRESQNMIESAKRKLRLWDVAEQDIDAIAKSDKPPKDVPFRSGFTGHIEDKAIVQGSAVQPMTKLLRVSDHTKMWLDAQVYQDQVPRVQIGQDVVATVDGIPGKTWRGTVMFIYPHMDHMTRTLMVRTTLDNPDFELKPGMYATVQVVTKPAPDALLIPQEAVIDTGTKQIVFVAESAGHFVPRKIRVGRAGDDNHQEVLEGLVAGETVVTSGQFLMDVESRTIEATEKLTSPSAERETAIRPTEMEPMGISPSTMPTASIPTTSMPPMDSVSQMSTMGMKPQMARQELSIAFCPMEKANWLQRGDTIANPYKGQAMSTCGSVQKKVPTPAADSELNPLIQPYLNIEMSLDSDTLNPAACAALKAVTEKLSVGRYAELRITSIALVDAKDVTAARAAFHAFSDQLIAAIETSPK